MTGTAIFDATKVLLTASLELGRSGDAPPAFLPPVSTSFPS